VWNSRILLSNAMAAGVVKKISKFFMNEMKFCNEIFSTLL
jgi:hypothetical protein